jgi:16S rRNA (guanine966-N2)-methyltransferase
MEVNFTVLVTKVINYISQSNEQFDIIFYDPPFSTSKTEIDNELNIIQNLMNKNSKLVIHRHKSSDQFVYPNGLELYREKNYGQSRITILKK